jgi:dihydroxyacetone kinase DhaKLM complex PTS-EIIA-like component DhaM
VANRTLNRLREKIRRRQYVMTLHAEEEMDDDALTIYDVESVILTGELIEQQRDRKSKERKYLVRGHTVAGDVIAVVVSKFGSTGKLVILTVYVE